MKRWKAFHRWTPFTHASMFLFASAVIGHDLLQESMAGSYAGGIGRVFASDAVSMTMPSGMAIIGLVIMSKIMAGTGQTDSTG